MPKAVKVSPMLNHDRLRIIRKGHANVSDLQKFIPASRTKAQAEYQTIAREIMLAEGKEVAWYGIEITVLRDDGSSDFPESGISGTKHGCTDQICAAGGYI